MSNIVQHNGVTQFTADNFSLSGNIWNFTDNTPPPGQIIVPPGYTRQMSGVVGYAAGNIGNRSIDTTELINLFGFASATQSNPPVQFPYVSGSGPVIHGLQVGKCIIAHFKTPATGHFLCSWAYQSNWGGPAVDVSVSTIGGDFGDHGSVVIGKTNLLPDGQPWMKLVVEPGTSTPVTGYLANNADYYFNLKYHDVTAHANQLYSIWYGYPLS